MRLYLSLILCVSLGAGSSGAMAAGGFRYGYCESFIPGSAPMPHHTYNTNYPARVSGVLDFGEGGSDKIRAAEQQFRGHLGAAQNATCDRSFSTAKEAREYIERRLKTNAGYDIATGWTGSFGASDGGDNRKSASPGGFHITIEDNGIAARTKAFDDAVLQGQRAEAQRKVAAAVVSARQDAKIKALIAAEMDKMRKRGNKQ